MNINLKSIIYSFIAKEVQVYIPNEINDALYINNLICSNCGNIWHTSLLECYFCGSVNSYLYKCDCGKYVSITNSTKSCPNCKSKNLYKICYNPNCISNTDKNINNLVNKSGGIFELNSSYNLALQNCYYCGEKLNEYKSYLIFVCPQILEVENFENTYNLNILKEFLEKKIEENEEYKNEYILFKIKNNNKDIRYIFHKIEYFYETNFEKVEKIYKNISQIIDFLYPINDV